MHRYFLFLIISLTVIHLTAQTNRVDSLKLVLKEVDTKQAKLSTLKSLNEILISKSSLKDALPYFAEMAEIAKQLGDDELESRAYKYSSEAYMKQMDSVNSIAYAKKGLSITTENNYLNNYLIGINQLGRAYHHFQYYNKAIATYKLGIEKYEKSPNEKCLSVLGQLYSNSSASYEKIGDDEASINAILKGVEIAEKTNSKNQKSYSLYALGYKYMNMKNYKKAEDYFLESLTFSDSVSLQTFVNMNHHGLGINYSRWGKYDKALYHNEIALGFFRQQGDKLYEFDVLNNTAVVYQRLNKPDSVIIYAKKALKIAKEINHKQAITGANITLSNAYIDKKKYSKAESILLEVAKDTINPKVIDLSSKASIYSKLSEIYEGKYNYKKSLKYHKIFKTLNDSIEKGNLDSKFSDLETKYQTEKKEKVIEQLRADDAEKELELQKKKSRNKLLVLLLIAAIVVISVLIYLYNKRRKAQKQSNYKYQLEVDLLKQEKTNQQQLIASQTQTIDNLEQTITKKDKHNKLQFQEKEAQFHKHLSKHYNLSDVELTYWIDQSNGIIEKQMMQIHSKSKGGIESRGKRLRAKIKEKKGIDYSIPLSKEEMTRYYKEDLIKFNQ